MDTSPISGPISGIAIPREASVISRAGAVGWLTLGVILGAVIIVIAIIKVIVPG